MSIYSHKSKKDSLWLHFTASKIVTPLKRLAVGWKPITSTIVFMITASMGLDSELLNGFINELGWEALLNTRGTTWRKLDETTRNKITDAASAAALMTEMPAIIKRPLLCAPGKPMLLGFSDSSYQQFFHEV
ncbi:putative glutaredoxin [Escherichia coli]|uniref:Putative glutaredoxin n=8 Tax=root TaxID=1 RepID=A0A2X3K3A9_ECOLX|nr:putative glutaredoxin [Escherichia coli]